MRRRLLSYWVSITPTWYRAMSRAPPSRAAVPQYAGWAALRDALNNTGRPIYYSICEINAVIESAAWRDQSRMRGVSAGR